MSTGFFGELPYRESELLDFGGERGEPRRERLALQLQLLGQERVELVITTRGIVSGLQFALVMLEDLLEPAPVRLVRLRERVTMLAQQGADRLRFAGDRGHGPLVELALVLAQEIADDLGVPTRLLVQLGPVGVQHLAQQRRLLLRRGLGLVGQAGFVLAVEGGEARRLVVRATFEEALDLHEDALAHGGTAHLRRPVRNLRSARWGLFPWTRRSLRRRRLGHVLGVGRTVHRRVHLQICGGRPRHAPTHEVGEEEGWWHRSLGHLRLECLQEHRIHHGDGAAVHLDEPTTKRRHVLDWFAWIGGRPRCGRGPSRGGGCSSEGFRGAGTPLAATPLESAEAVGDGADDHSRRRGLVVHGDSYRARLEPRRPSAERSATIVYVPGLRMMSGELGVACSE